MYIERYYFKNRQYGKSVFSTYQSHDQTLRPLLKLFAFFAVKEKIAPQTFF
jgi:hypothetical protein